jgi:NADPH:quinone reductase-like Zn-dependent oxidoreductase
LEGVALMRAVVAERPAGPDGLVLKEVPRPEPRPGWALVRVEAFGLNRSEYKTLRGYAGDAVRFPRILGIELVGVVEATDGAGADAPVPPGTTVAALMGDMGRAFDGGYAEYALVPEHQLIALETTLPWEVLGALPETFMTAAGSLEHLDLQPGQTLLLRGATSSVGLACLELARARGVNVVATTRNEAKTAKLTELRAAKTVLDGDDFVERAKAALPEGGADAAVDLIGGPAVLETLHLIKPGGTVCNSGSLSNTWLIPDFEPIAMIPSGRKLTAFHSDSVHDARVSGPLLRTVVKQVERGEVAPNIDTVYSLEETIEAHRRMRPERRPASSSCSPAGDQLRDRELKRPERGIGLQGAAANLVGAGVNQGERGGDEPAGRDVRAKRALAPAALDQLADRCPRAVVRPTHRLGAQLVSRGARDLIVVGDLLPARRDQPL